MSVEDAASRTQPKVQSGAPEQQDVLRIIADVERSLDALRAHAGPSTPVADARIQQNPQEDALALLRREAQRLEDERTRLLERQVALESQLASAHAGRTVAEERARRAEDARSRLEQETINAQINRETEFIKSLETRASAEQARAAELERQCAELRHEVAVSMSKLTAALKIAEKHSLRENELEAEVGTLRAEVEVVRALQREGRLAIPDAPQTGEQIQQTIMPRLTQVAGFLRVRKQRLRSLHQALKRRANALRVLRQLYEAQPAILAEEAEAVRHERGALEAEREEFTKQREDVERRLASVAEAEQRIAKSSRRFAKAAGITRIALAATVAVALLAGSALLSWHVASLLAPKDAVATVELQTTTRGSESVPADSAPIGEWLKSMLQTEAFVGVVAGRLVDRGYARQEADELVAPLAKSLHVEHAGPSVLLTLRGKGVDQSSALLDAFVATAISESARQPERKADQLRLTVLGARTEPGRTVVSRAMLMKDETHLARAAVIFSMMATLGAGFVAAYVLYGRRAKGAAPATA